MSDVTSKETTEKLTAVDTQLDGASSPQAANDALNLLGEVNPADRNAVVAAASQYLTQQGELPEMMLIPQSSENLQSLFDREGNVTKEALKDAAETGVTPYGIQLSVNDQIVANALYTNFDAIQNSVGQDPTDQKISLNDLQDQRDASHSMPREMGENRLGLNSAVTMLGDGEGNLDTKKFEGMFGTATPTRAQLQHFKDDPNGYGAATPSDKLAVDFMIDRFTDLNGGRGNTLDENQVWNFASSRGINYRDQMQQLQNETDAYNKEHTVAADLTKDEVDSLIEELAAPDGDVTMFDKFDARDGNRDGLVLDTALADSNTFVGHEAEVAKELAEHIKQFDDNGDGRVYLSELAKQSATYAGTEDIITKAQDNKAQEIRDQEADTPGDITDDTKAAMMLFSDENGNFDDSKWKSILLPGWKEGDPTDVDRNKVMNAIRSDQYDNLTPYEQRGLTSLFDHFGEYSNAMGADSTIGPEEFAKAVSEKGIALTDEEQRKKVAADQDAFNAKNGDSPNAEVLSSLRAAADADNYLEENFNDQKDMSSAELNSLIGKLEEGDPKRDLLEYMSKFHDQLAGQDGDPNNYLSIADMDAFEKAGPSTADASENADNVKLSYWWGDAGPSGIENELKFGALINPEDPQAGADALAEMNHMTREDLRQCFFEYDAGGLMIPREVYEQYYGVPYEDQDQAA